MKGLSKFFDTARFLSGKRLEVVGVAPWNEYETKEVLGTKISTVIADDQTVYPPAAVKSSVTSMSRWL